MHRLRILEANDAGLSTHVFSFFFLFYTLISMKDFPPPVLFTRRLYLISLNGTESILLRVNCLCAPFAISCHGAGKLQEMPESKKTLPPPTDKVQMM